MSNLTQWNAKPVFLQPTSFCFHVTACTLAPSSCHTGFLARPWAHHTCLHYGALHWLFPTWNVLPQMFLGSLPHITQPPPGLFIPEQQSLGLYSYTLPHFSSKHLSLPTIRLYIFLFIVCLSHKNISSTGRETILFMVFSLGPRITSSS